LEALHNADDEPCCDEPFVFELESIELDRQQLKELVYKEMCKFRPEEVRHHSLTNQNRVLP